MVGIGAPKFEKANTFTLFIHIEAPQDYKLETASSPC